MIAVNNYGNGWSCTIDAYGNAVINSPDGTSTYYNQSLVININGKDYTYVFTNGSPAGTGEPYLGETIAFCKAKKGWTEYYPFVPECYGRLRMDYVSFVNGELWLHGDKSRYNWFYDNHFNRTLTAIFNHAFEKVKIMTHIEVNTDTPCYCPNITIPATDQNQIGMNTELTKAAFKVVHGKYWAKIPRDKLTPWFTDQQQAWVNGRNMTGQVAAVEISNDADTLAPLIEANLSFIFTEKS